MVVFKRKTEFDFKKTKAFFDKNKSFDKKNFMKCPEWMIPEIDENGLYIEEPDDFLPLYDIRMQKKFFSEGKLAIGALVQANVLLFKRGKEDCPADFIYTTEPFFIENPTQLIRLAYSLFDIKGEYGFKPSIQYLANLLADEHKRVFAYKLPKDVLENKEVYFTSIMVSREHLAKKKIESKLQVYPMIVLEGEKPEAMILPHWFWK